MPLGMRNGYADRAFLESLKGAAGEDGYWYVATPYTKYAAGIEAAFREACRIAAWLIRNGVYVYAPIAHTHPVAVYGELDPLTNHPLWLRADRPMMLAAFGLLVVKMPGWVESRGVQEEIDTFVAQHKPIEYLEWGPK